LTAAHQPSGTNDEATLSAELLHEGYILSLYRETVRLLDGRITTRDIVRHNGAVAILPIDAAGNVLLVRQYRQAARRILVELPAGTLEKGEEPEACALRECQEETGYKPGKLIRLGGVFLAPGYSTEYIHLYLATDLTASKLAQDDDEFLDLLRLPLDDVTRMIRTGEIEDAKTVSAMFMYTGYIAGK